MKRDPRELGIDIAKFGALLRRRAEQKGLKIGDVAYHCDRNYLTTKRWFLGQFLPGDFKTMQKLIDTLGITKEELSDCGFKSFCKEDKPKEQPNPVLNLVPLIKAISCSEVEELDERTFSHLVRIYRELGASFVTLESIRSIQLIS